MWQVAVLWCYVEGVITVKVAVRLKEHKACMGDIPRLCIQ